MYLITGAQIFRDNIARFNIFNNLPVIAVYSWGKDSEVGKVLNYSALSKFEDPDVGSRRTAKFLEKNRMPKLKDFVCIEPIYPPNAQGQILEITNDSRSKLNSVNGFSETQANFIWTKEVGITLGVKPGDCVVFTLFGKFENGNSVLGVCHMSYHSVDLNLGYDAIKMLVDQGVDIKSMRIGIGPSISVKNYSFPIHEKDLIRSKDNWHGALEERGDRLHLDLRNATVSQLVLAGVGSENIELAGDDTFEAARRRISFSDRYAKSMKSQDPSYKDGRIIFVSCLK